MTANEIQTLLERNSGVVADETLAGKLATYLDLLVRWNARTNLSAIREPAQMVTRHFGESLQCARALPAGIGTVLDYGSGAGFPGAVIALACPGLAVTLAESQGKKAAFLQELARTLELNAKVHAARVDTLPVATRFDAVALRAVDKMEQACAEAIGRVRPGGWLILLTTPDGLRGVAESLRGIAWRPPVPLKGADHGIIAMGRVLLQP